MSTWSSEPGHGLTCLILVTTTLFMPGCSRASSLGVVVETPDHRTGLPVPDDAVVLPRVFLERPEPVLRDPRNASSSSSSPGTRQQNDPLVVTPFLEAGDAETARRLSAVGFIVDGLQESHSGLFLVNKEFGSHLFFWLFRAKSGNTSAPLLLWLNGGPGTSSLLGVLAETGPIRFDPVSLEPKLADTPAWTDDFDVLYIDQPVGTGFSYASNADGFATSQEEIVLDLFEAFQQFFQLFPEYYEKPLYLTGISYAGKYVPWLAVRVHDENQKPETRQYPLEGIVTINGFTDPTSAFSDTAQFLYQHGLVDRNGEAQIQEGAEILAQATELEDWLTAVLIIADFGNNETGLLNNLTGYTQMYNVADPYDQGLPPGTWEIYPEFVNQPKIRDAIHVGQTPFGGGYDVQASLLLDFPQSAKDKLVTILNNNYKVLLLNGAIDLVLGPRTCTSLLNSSNDWRDLELYQQSKQEILKDETGSVVGYLTKVRNMWQAKVLGGTHYAPANVPGPVYSILKEFIAASSIGR